VRYMSVRYMSVRYMSAKLISRNATCMHGAFSKILLLVMKVYFNVFSINCNAYLSFILLFSAFYNVLERLCNISRMNSVKLNQ